MATLDVHALRGSRPARRAALGLALLAGLTLGGRAARADISVCVGPPDTTVILHDVFTVRVTADGPPADLQGYSISLVYDPSVLALVSSQGGSVLAGHPSTFLPMTPATGTLVMDGVALGETTAGPGTLALVTFQAVTLGASQLHLGEVEMRNSLNDPIPAVTCDGQVTVTGVTRIAPSTWHGIKEMYRR